MLIKLIHIFCLSMTLGFSQKAQVYLFSGQSNMEGSGLIGELTAEEKKKITNVKIWQNNKFVVIEPGKPPFTFTFGPELFFAKTIGRSVIAEEAYVIKYSLGGKALDQGWDDNTWLGSDPEPNRQNFYPGKSEADPNIGNMYTSSVSVWRSGLKYMKDNDIPYEIKAILWMQGEQDAKSKISATRYAKNLKWFIKRLYEDLDIKPIVPFIFGEVLPDTENVPTRFYAAVELKNSQFNAHHSSGHEDAIENAYIVPTKGFQINDDFVHFGTEGQRSLGKGMADTVLSISNISAVIKRKKNQEDGISYNSNYLTFDLKGALLKRQNMNNMHLIQIRIE